jgi:hypothetical protein
MGGRKKIMRWCITARHWVLIIVLNFTIWPPLLADSLEMNVLETNDLRLFYLDPLQTYLVPHTARSFHNSLDFQRKIFDWTPYDDQTAVLLKDFADYGNASATSSPINLLMIDIAPPSHTFETLPGSERIYSTMNHELVHVATGDAWNEQDAWWRRFFGGKPSVTNAHPESILYYYLATPRMAVPRWYTEGSAVFLETWMSGGLGRAQGAFDEMVFRSMVRDDAHFYSALGLVSQGTRIDFQVGVNAYLYGTRFMNYLALEYSPEKLIDWLKRGEDSKRYYASQFMHIYGKSLEDSWDDWIAWEHDFQKANLKSVRQFPLTQTRPLTKQGAGSISRSYFDAENNTMVGAFRIPGIVAHVGVLSLDDGSVERVTDIKGPMLYMVSSTAYDPKGKTVFFTNDNHNFRDILAVDLKTGKDRMLLKDARIGDLAFDSSNEVLWGLRHLDGYVTLVRIPAPYDSWSQVYTWPYGTVPFEIDISPDGKLLSTSMGELDGKQYLRVFRVEDLQEENAQPMAEFNFGDAIPEGFVFSPDGRYLFGSSYLTGISNIFRYEIETDELEAVSNAETGFFRPIPLADGSLIVFEFTGQGFVPSVIDPVPLQDVSAIVFLGTEVIKKHPVLEQWNVGSPADVPLDDLITKEGMYTPRRELQGMGRYPIIEGYLDSVALGYNWEFTDPMLFNTLSMNASYSIDSSLDSSERLHADIEYKTLDWSFRYWHNNADFYDLFGPTKRSRKGDAFIVTYDKALIFDLPRRLDLEIGAAYYTGLDTLPNNQNVPTSFSELASAAADLSYTHTRRSLGAVDHEKGFRWNTAGFLDFADNELVPKFLAGFDFGFALPWKHSSVWLYNSAGLSGGDRDNALANWYFGAYGNNYVDERKTKRYREFYSFPGFDLDQVYGQSFIKSVFEWNLPPITFEKVGTPSFYLTWIRTALFTGGLVTDIDNDRLKETYANVGIQVDLRFTIVHRLPMTLSVGFAQGYIDGHKFDNEWMISLKIL